MYPYHHCGVENGLPERQGFFTLFTDNNKQWDSVEYAQSRGWPVFLDSGAFSAMTQQFVINNQEYLKFCKQHNDIFQTIASLDVIGDWEETQKNYLEACELGLITIPTFHVREPFDALKLLISKSDYIALGVAKQQNKRRAVMAWLTKCWRIITQYKSCKVHGFALTSDKVMASFPWFSVDSTTWSIPLLRMRHVLVMDKYKLKQIDYYNVSRYVSLFDKYPMLRLVRKKRLTKDDYIALMVHNIKILLEWKHTMERSYKKVLNEDCPPG